MSAEEICNRMGLKARWKWTAGELRKTPKSTPLGGTYKSTYCCFDLVDPRGYELVDFLNHWNEKLDPLKPFFEHIRSTGGSLEYFVALYFEKNSGVVFNLSLLNQLVDLGIQLSFDLYGGKEKKKRLIASGRRK